MFATHTRRPWGWVPCKVARRTTRLVSASRPRYDPRVSDTWPRPGPQRRPPTLEHIRDLWTLHWSQSNCTAAIWRNDFGLELRVLHGDELIESRLSRFGDAPLLLIAEEVKANLIEQGWTETPNASADA